MEDKIKTYIAKYQTEDILAKLVQIDTQNPPGNESSMVRFIKQYIKSKYPQTDMMEFKHTENRSSLVIRIEGENQEDCIAFIGHMDTVPAENVEDWIHNPFEGYIDKNRRMFGRGTTDMKGGLASMLLTLEYVLENNIVLDNDIYFVFTADEESKCIGIQEVIKSGVFKNISQMIVAEPTEGHIGCSERGAVWVELNAIGKQAHGAIPEEGINPIELLNQYITWLKEEITKEVLHSESVTISTTVFHSGDKNNVIPNSAKAVLDIRTESEEQQEEVKEMLQRIADRIYKEKNLLVFYHIISEKIPVSIDVNHPFVYKFKQIVQRINSSTDFVNIPYYTDLACICECNRIPFVILGPGDMKLLHTVNESIDINKVEEVAEIYINYIEYYIRRRSQFCIEQN